MFVLRLMRVTVATSKVKALKNKLNKASIGNQMPVTV